MQLLYLASECAPFVKTGGLADVIGSVPKALSALGLRSRILLPAYPALAKWAAKGKSVWQSDDLFGGSAQLLAVEAEGLELLLLEAPHFFQRPGGLYLDAQGQDYADNAQRFAALAWVAAQVAVQGIDGWRPDLVHAHDWQASLVAAYLKQMPEPTPPCITTIHNIAFQGLFEPELMGPLGLSPDLFHADGLEFYGRLGFLKAGLAFSHAVTTVSPTYAKELMTPEFGMGLEGLLHARHRDFVGILNGIDLEAWDPQSDAQLAANYGPADLAGKAINKQKLAERFGVEHDPSAPLFCVISRLTRQKGLDLLLEAVPSLVARGAKLVVLGTGDSDLEAGFRAANRRFPQSVGCVIGYDEGLAHLLQGGSDAILIPSRFEPCGLTQLYGLRYGTVPVVARTGGLADTVIDANEAALMRGCATGFLHDSAHLEALEQTIHRVCDLFQDQERWASMRAAAMEHPVGWQDSAQAYLQLYQRVLSAAGLAATPAKPAAKDDAARAEADEAPADIVRANDAGANDAGAPAAPPLPKSRLKADGPKLKGPRIATKAAGKLGEKATAKAPGKANGKTEAQTKASADRAAAPRPVPGQSGDRSKG